MEKKTINAYLKNDSNELCQLVFDFSSEDIVVDLYKDDLNTLQILFSKITETLITNDVVFSFDESKSGKNNQLAFDVCKEYIKQLNIEVESLLKSNNLKDIREYNEKNNIVFRKE